MAMARQAADDAAFLRRAKAFVRLLRNQAGIPVRQPAHAVAPFRAEPIMWGAHVQLYKTVALYDLTYDLPVLFSPQLVYRNVSGTATVSSTEDQTRGPSDAYYIIDNTVPPPPIEVAPFTDSATPTPFTTPGIDPFPDGYLGFVTGIEVTTFRGDNVSDHIVVKDLRYTVLIDGQAVSGFTNAYPRIELGQNDVTGLTVPAGFLPRGGSVQTQLAAPIQIRPGQRMTIRLRAPQAVAAQSIVECRAQVFGYKIPTKSGGDRTIYDTLTD